MSSYVLNTKGSLIRIAKTVRFEAAHQLTAGLPEGHKCRTLHGHSWVAVVEVSAMFSDLNDLIAGDGLLLDFGVISKAVMELDHKNLNEVMTPMSPTSENVAIWIAKAVQSRIDYVPGRNVVVNSVTVEETCTSACYFEPNWVMSHELPVDPHRGTQAEYEDLVMKAARSDR